MVRRLCAVVVGGLSPDPQTALGERVPAQQSVRAAAALGARHVLGEVVGEAQVGDGVQDRQLLLLLLLLLIVLDGGSGLMTVLSPRRTPSSLMRLLRRLFGFHCGTGRPTATCQLRLVTTL